MGVVARSVLHGAAVGTVFVGVFATILMVKAAQQTSPPAYVPIVFGVAISVVFGGVPGALIGIAVGFVRRRAGGPVRRRPAQVLIPDEPYDMWSDVVERCAESARRVAAAVRTVPKSSAKDWLRDISDKLAKELDDARGIAQLGRALGAVDLQHPVYQRLLKAASDFERFENEVGRVALQMFDHPELDEARTHLEMLEKQLPQLSA